MGKPVIATKTATMELFKDHVFLCTSLTEYQDALEKALLDKDINNIRNKIMFAQSHSWENNVNYIYKLIEDFIR